jgi:hypothetical protein
VPDQLDVRAREADFFVQLAKERIFDLLTAADATLRELPAAPAAAAAQKDIALAVHQDDAHVRSIAFRVD